MKKTIIRILSLLLCLTMLSGMVFTAFAAEEDPTQPQVVETEADETEPEVVETEAAETEPEVTETEAAETEPEVVETEAVETEPEVTETEVIETEPEETVEETFGEEEPVVYSIGENEYGEITFETFEDLEMLCKDPDMAGKRFSYAGEGELVIKRDITLPEYTSLYAFWRTVIIPKGVTFHSDNTNRINVGSLTVEGTANMGYTDVRESLVITGTYYSYGVLNTFGDTVAKGLDKIQHLHKVSRVSITALINSKEDMKTWVKRASEDTRDRVIYHVNLGYKVDLVVDWDLTLPKNCTMQVGSDSSLKVAKGCTLTVSPVVYGDNVDLNSYIIGPTKVYGKLVNNGIIYMEPDNGGKLTIAGGGRYQGNGRLSIYSRAGETPETAIRGLDLDLFKIEQSTNSWALWYQGSEPIGPDEDEAEPISIYRLYNPYTLEHLFTNSEAEYEMLGSAGWRQEGVAWTAPEEGAPVYRLYNPYDDSHFYSKSREEVDFLLTLGYREDGVMSYGAAEADGTPIYRLFNPYEAKNYHHFTTSWEECEFLTGLGWKLEGVAWYAAK